MIEHHLVIVGLGNPGREYQDTRHNLGFLVVQALATELKVNFAMQSKFESAVAESRVLGKRVHFLLPQTYMNESGRAVAKFLNFYKLSAKELIVVVDDMDLPVGHLRIRLTGGPGGHNGLKSIQFALGTFEYLRLRMGIGRDETAQSVDHVLGRFTSEEKKLLPEYIAQGVRCLKRLITEDFHKVANDINRKVTITGLQSRIECLEENKE